MRKFNILLLVIILALAQICLISCSPGGNPGSSRNGSESGADSSETRDSSGSSVLPDDDSVAKPDDAGNPAEDYSKISSVDFVGKMLESGQHF